VDVCRSAREQEFAQMTEAEVSTAEPAYRESFHLAP
jgi:hypothetical protein